MKIAFLSDVEGRWSKLVDFCEGNLLVSLVDGDIQVADGPTVVYGGDTIDRGPYSRAVLSALIEGKERQPDQVVLLAGNRDVNKLRLPRELAGHPRAGAPQGTRAEILRWTLAKTMGAADAFEHRRTELGHRSADEDVVDSMLADVSARPTGLLLAYLLCSQLAWRSEETLFVHGGVTEANLGVVPGDDRSYDVDEWIWRLNRFYRQQVDAYANDPMGVAHHALIAYQAPLPGTRANDESVIYARPVDARGNALPPSPALRARLRDQGIRRIVVGHTPAGDTPAICRVDGFESIIADSSYGNLERGSQVLLDRSRTSIRAWVRPVGEQPQRLTADLHLDEPSIIGRRVRETGQLVKGRLDDGRYVLCRFLDGFRAEEVAVDTVDEAALD